MGIFATRLRELRGPESQASFAASIGLNRVQYAKYESGRNLPSIEILERICRVAPGITSDWLLGLDDRGKSAAVTVNGNNNAVGANARVTIRGTSAPLLGHPLRGLAPLGGYAPGEMPACSKCPYKKKWQKIESMK